MYPPPQIDSQSAVPPKESRRQFPNLLSTQLIDWHVAERGENFAVMEKVRFYNMEDATEATTNRYTVLGNGMHYLEDGEWKESEDVIEVFPEGAIARKGPNRTIFSPDLNAEAVVDMETSAGDRIRGGVRSIQITDAANGVSRVIAEVKQNAPGELLPPNRIVYRDAFNGLRADVVYVWRRDRFSQNVVFLERPEIPQGVDSQNARLEVVTEFLEAPEPDVKRKFIEKNGVEIIDDALIEFGNLLIVPGKALSTGEGSFTLDVANPFTRHGIHVAKEWIDLEEGVQFLIESVDWEESAAALQDLPPRRRAEAYQPSRVRQTAGTSRPLPRSIEKDPNYPMQVAAMDYEVDGFLIDVTTLSGGVSSQTFETGQTYLIASGGFSAGSGSITFEPGCVIKNDPNATGSFVAYGPLDFPEDTLQKVVFTSKNDNGFGEKISGSTGSPSQSGKPLLWSYYVDFSNTIQNAWFRWAEEAVEFSTNPSDQVGHWIVDCLFQECDTAVQVDTDSYVTLSDSEKCEVDNDTNNGSNVSGSLSAADDCIDLQFTGADNFTSPYEQYAAKPPDSMGAVGPDHFIELVNSSVSLFNKDNGARLDFESLEDFFNAGSSSVFDPRIVFDTHCDKWIACAMVQSENKIYFAISNTNAPSDLSTSNWDLYSKTVTVEVGDAADFPTLGVDDNGVYVVVHQNDDDTSPHSITPKKTLLVISKDEDETSCLDGASMSDSDIQEIIFEPPDEMIDVIIQPAVNFDAISTNDPAWFIAKGKPETNSYEPGAIHFFRIEWNGVTPEIITNSWGAAYDPSTDYYDLDLDRDFSPPQLGGNEAIDMTGSRLAMALIQDDYLWSCHHVGLDGTDGDYGGNETNSIDRTGIQWFKFSVGSTNLTHSSSGMVYDDANENDPYFFFFPSMMINEDGAGLIGFSGSQEDEYYGAFYSAKLDAGSFLSPKLIIAGQDEFSYGRWGDYSYTSIDPENKKHIWTVQEYAKHEDSVITEYYGTVVSKVILNY